MYELLQLKHVVLRAMYQLLKYGNIVDVFLVSVDVWANVAILLVYGSHDMRQVFRRLTVVNGTPWNLGCHNLVLELRYMNT